MVKNECKKVFLVCTGLGHVNRGYESFALDCYLQLKTSTKFKLYLLKGSGPSHENEIRVACIKRTSHFAFRINKLFGIENYWLEQVSFFICLIPSIIKHKPTVIYYSDFILGTFLWHIRRILKFKYTLLFSNGAPNGPPYKTEDHVQQLLPMYISHAKLAGELENKQTLLPYAIHIDEKQNLQRLHGKPQLLNKLQLPKDKMFVICVSAINSIHKRIDYLIREFALLNRNDFFLLVLGQIEEGSLPILELAKNTLNQDSYLIKQVQRSEVIDYLCIADYFILPSLNEGLPRVLPEALSAGLLPIVHDYNVTRETLNQYGVFTNMNDSGVLKGAISEVNKRNVPKKVLIEYALNTYDWELLKPKYENMICKLL